MKQNIIQNWFFWRRTVTICKYNSVDKIYENGMEGQLPCTGKEKWMRGIGGETWKNIVLGIEMWRK